MFVCGDLAKGTLYQSLVVSVSVHSTQKTSRE